MSRKTYARLKMTKPRESVETSPPRATPQSSPLPAPDLGLPPGYGHDFRSLSVFPKLEVNAPQDRYEQEADAVNTAIWAVIRTRTFPKAERAAHPPLLSPS